MSEKSSIEEYKLQKLIKELESKEGRGTELISLYIPPGRQISDVMNALKQEYSQASNIKDRRTRHHVLDALTSCIQRLKLFKTVPENGLVIFCGYISTGIPGDEKMEIHMIIPSEPIRTYLYRCDSKFYLDPLKEIITEKEFYGLIVMDRNEATFAILKGRQLYILDTITSGVPGKHDAGGQSQRRYERVIEQMAHEFYKRVAEYAEKFFLNTNITLQGIIIGGPGKTKEEFAKGNYLHYQLQSKILGVVDTGYTSEEGIYELVNRSKDLLQNVKYIREKNIMQEFLTILNKDDSCISYGLSNVENLLSLNLVEKILLSTDLENLERIILQCSNCGYRMEKVINLSEESKILSEPCPKCNGQMIINDKKIILDEIIEKAEANGVKIELISTETEEGEQLRKSFGGVAAILRYKISDNIK
ncbi:MAG: peptide chain release factor aRF-1 [Candidatus Methanomethylicia archaeon]